MTNEYTDWSRKIAKNLPKEWLKSNLKLFNSSYDILNENNVIMHDEQYLIIINKSKDMPDSNEKIFKTNNKRCGLNITNKYKVNTVLTAEPRDFLADKYSFYSVCTLCKTIEKWTDCCCRRKATGFE